ncbi:MAG TPA: hypothetical protein VFH72_00710 [Candidatus Baltobacteraceae bacterium]|nr:hypothetical protein [Candidatus Baltobacteraceae bacterium]
MPLQNRVTPFGEILALPGRGLLCGNRGILHDDHRRIVRFSQCRRWIACALEYREIRRTPMTPHTWTELFFLDEATAFSAGHRPCAECRRADYNRYKAMWEGVHGDPVSADVIDRRLQADRGGVRRKRTYEANLQDLPDGTFVALNGDALLVWDAHLYTWSDAGYTTRRPRQRTRDVEVLTPHCTVAILAAGYRPLVHPSASPLLRPSSDR